MHVLEKFRYCPVCGSSSFEEQDEKSKRCKRCGFEYYLNPSAAVAAFVLNSKGQLLTLRRSKAPAKGTLDLPGGFADIGETIDEALMREVKEETGLTVTEFEFFHPPQPIRVQWFCCAYTRFILHLQSQQRNRTTSQRRCGRSIVARP